MVHKFGVCGIVKLEEERSCGLAEWIPEGSCEVLVRELGRVLVSLDECCPSGMHDEREEERRDLDDILSVESFIFSLCNVALERDEGREFSPCEAA